MTPAVKRCLIRALETPSKRASREIKELLEEIRQAAWQASGNTLTLKLDALRGIATKRLQVLQRLGTITQWHVDVWQDDWAGYRVKIEYGSTRPGLYGQPVSFVGTCSIRL